MLHELGDAHWDGKIAPTRYFQRRKKKVYFFAVKDRKTVNE